MGKPKNGASYMVITKVLPKMLTMVFLAMLHRVFLMVRPIMFGSSDKITYC